MARLKSLVSVEISQKLKEIFQLGSARESLILIVHDEQFGRNALKDLGLNTSTWESGLKVRVIYNYLSI